MGPSKQMNRTGFFGGSGLHQFRRSVSRMASFLSLLNTHPPAHPATSGLVRQLAIHGLASHDLVTMLTFPRIFVVLVTIVVRAVRILARSRADLVLENLALRQHVIVLKRERPRPHLDDADRGLWVALRLAWPGWLKRLAIVSPDTIVTWHRKRFRRYWTRISHKNRRPGRPRIDREVRKLIRTMALDNGWGAPRIHGELLKLGLALSEATVLRYMPRRPPDPGKVQRWMTFLRNHSEAIAAMDFFTVPTIRLRVLYCFFVIEHGRRRVLHFNATPNPTSAWVIQQLREAFPFDTEPRHLILDRDTTFGLAVVAFVRTIGTKPSRTAFMSPWQNPVAERWIGSCRRELLDHVVVFDQRHAVRLVREYIAYHHEDRTHMGLGKDTPDSRAVTSRPSPTAKVVALPRVGGLHHRYEWLLPPDRRELEFLALLMGPVVADGAVRAVIGSARLS